MLLFLFCKCCGYALRFHLRTPAQTLLLLVLELIAELHASSLKLQSLKTNDESTAIESTDVAVSLDLLRHHDFGVTFVSLCRFKRDLLHAIACA